jgi:hypothetical protein
LSSQKEDDTESVILQKKTLPWEKMMMAGDLDIYRNDANDTVVNDIPTQ